jgi:hypothetical protein
MDSNKSYFECKRCFYKTNIKTNMNKHLDIKILCDRKLESFKYKDDELRNLSLIRIYPKIKNDENTIFFICAICNKNFASSKSLKQHNKKSCSNSFSSNMSKNINIEDIEKCNDIISSNIEQANNENSYNTTTTTTNSNNISIVINNFDDKWNTDHIDDKLKLLLLLKKTKFTSTLQNILENEVNLNVLIDKTTETGLVYNNNTLQKMDVKDIVKKSMDKLFEQLKIFKDDLINHDLDIEEKYLDHSMNDSTKKLSDYHKNDSIKDTVNKLISQIYCKKNNNTAEICSSSSSDQGF